GSYKDVLICVRDRIHEGHTLLTHPLSGSVKPNETPYKSILISKIAKDLDLVSLQIIEDSINTYEKFMKNSRKYGNTNPEQLKDFQKVDYELLMGALKSIN
ncbi:MAG: GrdX family protein, partial [Eubacteriales bacterium]|nr:GrdX family protein [Eubacteriales bacterium]